MPDDHDERPPARPYLRVRPADDALAADPVRRQFTRLHALAAPDPPWWRRLLPGRATPPTIEFLLASTGGADPQISYYVGVDDPDARDALERTLRGLFPDTYAVEATEWHPARRLATDATDADDDRHVAAAEFRGRCEQRADWQTQLTPFAACTGADDRVPLAAVVETMADASVPMVYQALVRRNPDWTAAAEQRCRRLRWGTSTQGARLVEWARRAIVPEANDLDPPDREAIPIADRERIDEIKARNTRRSFVVNARAVAVADDEPAAAERAVDELATAFSGVGHTCYEIDAAVHTGAAAARVRDALHNRTVHPPNYERLATRLPWVANTSPGIVADVAEAPTFCLLDGTALTAAGARGVATRPDERTPLPRPPDDRLAPYRGDGLRLGRPLTQDDAAADAPVVLPPLLQLLNVVWFGMTGAGKSTALVAAILANHAATDGADILIDPKGDGMVRDYLRAHYARYGSLEDVYYFDCSQILPALSFFDVRDQLDAGIDRPTAVEDVVDHYVELLKGIMGPERYEQAVRSPDVIRYLCKALFDPVHGDDAFAHRDLQAAARRMHQTRDPPPVTDADLRQLLGGVAANSKRSFDELMQGVANRIEKIPVYRRLARLFNHVPADDDPHFDFAELLEEDVVVLFDTGGLRSETQRVLTLVLLSNLWTALRRRARDGDDPDDGRAADARPVGNLYLEEAAHVADTALLGDLLAQSRSFGLGVTLAMQFPGQLRERSPETYRELLNNVGTIVTGPIGVDRDLARRLATADMPPDAVAARLRALRRGQWLASLPAPFDEDPPRPFLLESLSPPAGLAADPDEETAPATDETTADAADDGATADPVHTADDGPPTEATADAADDGATADPTHAADDDPPTETTADATDDTTPTDPVHAANGGPPTETTADATDDTTPTDPAHATDDGPSTESDPSLVEAAITRAAARTREQYGLELAPSPAAREPAADHGDEPAAAHGDAAGDERGDAADAADRLVDGPIDTALPLTKRLPDCLTYDPEPRALRCRRCDSRYAPSLEGTRRGVECCHDRDAIARDDVPVHAVDLTLSPAERAATDYTDRQLAFLQVVVNAARRRYDPELEYDLLHDSMLRLQEYVGLEEAALDELVEDGLVRMEDHPHRLYTVTAAGRELIGETQRQGLDFGHGRGDLGESSQHVLGVEVGRRYLKRRYAAESASAVERVVPYYEGADRRRLDVAGLDADGDVVVAVEVERTNHDVREAVPADYDTMAAFDPNAAVWIVMTQAAGHTVLAALREPPDGRPRVEKTYSPTTPPQHFRLDAPGCTAIYSLTFLRNRLDRPDELPP